MYYNFECACVSSLYNFPDGNRTRYRQSEGYGFDSHQGLIRTRIQNRNDKHVAVILAILAKALEAR